MRLLQYFLLLLLLAMSSTPSSEGFNITKILAGHPELSSFNHYLSVTHLSSEINRRRTITVLALDNAAMSSLLDKHLSLPTLKNVLSLHCLVDYYGAKKLHQLTSGTALSSSFFQATGAAPGTTGFVNITDHRAGRVTFSAEDAEDGASPATFVKSIKEQPYNLSIVQISAALSSPEAEAPAAAPAPVNLTSAMSKSGCKLFADLLAATAGVLETYEANSESGLTAFCPIDAAVTAFAPKFKNLTAEEQASLLLYHAEPVYNSMQQLKTGNGLSTTLATGGPATKKKKKDYTFTVQTEGEAVTLQTKVVTAKILKTAADQEPVAVYSINKVLQPRELFKPVEAPAPAPAAPKKKGKAKKKKEAPGAAESPGDADDAAYSPDDAPADQKAADDNAAVGGLAAGYVLAVAAAAVSAFAVMV
ncbi:putative fasciclin-like arabinogalactan protein 1 [Iris pallida]|uniref:Fasciclin-like arabinogalactan protein 1 n=1 Tax=Iris pallida TaxID=29817 RepID=A0AAX6DSN0_IRIPA|nr:putative fasciclin-like arabinogalactan protein 1 [Iris pallida]